MNHRVAFALVLAMALSMMTVHHLKSKQQHEVEQEPHRRQLRLLGDPKTVVNKRSAQEVPRILHLCLLGNPSAPMYMHRVAHWVKEKLGDYNFEVWIWDNDKADELFAELGGHFIQTWHFTQSDQFSTKLARMADFLRLVVVYHFGGVYLDIDMIPCNGLDFMVDTPGVVSFPSLNERAGEVVNCAISAPPRHELLGLALHNIFVKGSEVANGFLDAAGPYFISTVVDEYLARKGEKFPSIAKKEAVPFPFDPNSLWTTVSDVRFADSMGRLETKLESALIHLHFGSWFPDTEEYNKDKSKTCEENYELIPPFLDGVCTAQPMDVFAKFRDCGRQVQR